MPILPFSQVAPTCHLLTPSLLLHGLLGCAARHHHARPRGSGGRNPTRVFPDGQSKRTRARWQGREEASERGGHARDGIAGRAVYHQSGDTRSAARIELPRRPPFSLRQEAAEGGIIWPRPPLLALRCRGTVHATR